MYKYPFKFDEQTQPYFIRFLEDRIRQYRGKLSIQVVMQYVLLRGLEQEGYLEGKTPEEIMGGPLSKFTMRSRFGRPDMPAGLSIPPTHIGPSGQPSPFIDKVPWEIEEEIISQPPDREAFDDLGEVPALNLTNLINFDKPPEPPALPPPPPAPAAPAAPTAPATEAHRAPSAQTQPMAPTQPTDTTNKEGK